MKTKEQLVTLGLTENKADEVMFLESEMLKRAVKFSYRKKDGTERPSEGTLDRKMMVQEDGSLWEPAGDPKPEDPKNVWFKYFDLGAKAWRQFNVFNLVAVEG